MRSRVIMIRLSGRMTPRVIASRSSATFLPEKSVRDAAAAAVSPALRAPFCACCWRPRAFPPALAARLRAGLVPADDRELELRELELLLRALPLRDDELPEPLRELVERELVDRELDPRELEPRVLELRDFDAPPLRDDEEDDFARVPPLLLLLRALLDPDPDRALELRDPALRDFDAPPPLRELLERDPEPPDLDRPPLLPPDDSAIALLLHDAFPRPEPTRVRAALFHADAAHDVRVIGQPQRAALAGVQFARLRRRPARRIDDVEPAREQVVDRIARGGRREPEAPLELLEDLGLARDSQVQVAAEQERQRARPFDRERCRGEQLVRRARHAVDTSVHVRDGQPRTVGAGEKRPEHASPLRPLRERVLAHLLDQPRRPYEQLVRSALVRGDEIGVQIGERRAHRAKGVA
jgi:hypothetical protein